jgi:hypothetical protein
MIPPQKEYQAANGETNRPYGALLHFPLKCRQRIPLAAQSMEED